MDEHKGETYGESGEFACALFLIGGAEHYEHKYECEHSLGDKSLPHVSVGIGVGSGGSAALVGAG